MLGTSINGSFVLFPTAKLIYGADQNGTVNYDSIGDGSNPIVSRTTSSGQGLTVATTGTSNSFFVNLFNDFLEPADPSSLGDLQVRVYDSSNTSITVNVLYIKTGVYNVIYTVPVYGEYFISVKLNGNNIPNSPYKLEAVSPCASLCVHGQCKISGTCLCDPGYTGTSCDTEFQLTQVGVGSTSGILSIAFGVLSLLSCLAGTFLVWKYRSGKFIRAGSPPMLVLIGLGLSIWSLFPIFSTIAYTPGSSMPCWAAPFVYFFVNLVIMLEFL